MILFTSIFASSCRRGNHLHHNDRGYLAIRWPLVIAVTAILAVLVGVVAWIAAAGGNGPEETNPTTPATSSSSLASASTSAPAEPANPPPELISASDPGPVFAVTGSAATEGNPAAFTIHLEQPAQESLVFEYFTVAGTALAGQDFRPVSTGSVALPAGATTVEFEIATVPDDELEPDETFLARVALKGSLADASAVAVSSSKTAISIISDRNPARLLEVRGAPAQEGEPARFSIELPAPAPQDVEVEYATLDASATAGEDYVAEAGTVTIPAGESRGSLEIQTLPDSQRELAESFLVSVRLSERFLASLAASDASDGLDPSRLGELEQQPELGLPGATDATLLAIGAILDPPPIAVSVSDSEAGEGDTMLFSVTLSEAAAEELSFAVSLISNGQDISAAAEPGADFIAPTDELIVPAGALTGIVQVRTLRDDEQDEADETFTLALQDPHPLLANGLPILLNDATATGTIANRVP